VAVRLRSNHLSLTPHDNPAIDAAALRARVRDWGQVRHTCGIAAPRVSAILMLAHHRGTPGRTMRSSPSAQPEFGGIVEVQHEPVVLGVALRSRSSGQGLAHGFKESCTYGRRRFPRRVAHHFVQNRRTFGHQLVHLLRSVDPSSTPETAIVSRSRQVSGLCSSDRL
jgi:hypothetical protein